MSRKSFYEICDILRRYLEKKRTRLRTPVSVEAQRLILVLHQRRRSSYITSNAFRMSRVSILGIITRVSCAVMIILILKLTRLPTTEGEVQELIDRCLKAYCFPQCIGAIDGTHIEIAEPNKHYSDLIKRKSYFSSNVQVVCDCKYYLQDVVVKWPDSVQDARIFPNSSINGIL